VAKTIDSLRNRNYKINLADLKNKEDSSHKKLTFRCFNYDEKKCLTSFYGLDTTRDKFFSLIRKWQTIIEINSDLKTKDGFFIRIFLVAFSRKRKNQTKKTSYIKASQVRTIRRKMGEILIREGTNCIMKDLIPKIISEKLVDEIGYQCSKIYPLQNVIIRKVKVLERPIEF
jgi:small subunit ribosomal protein S3Ae